MTSQPVHATTLTLAAPDGAADAYLVRPDDTAGHPPVLLYPDIMGLRPSMTRIADRLAAAGYTVLVPHVFYRSGPAPVVEMPEAVTDDNLWDVVGAAVPVAGALTVGEAMRDAAFWLDTLQADRFTSGGPVGITGYCNGGMLCLRTAGTYPDRVAAAAIVHGSHLITEAPDSPHLVAGRVRAEVLLANGDQDTVNPPEEVERFTAVLSAAGVRHRSEMYPGAQHGFCSSDLLPLYDRAADERHHAALLDLFGRTL
ncbi:dienelactone hydrolase family protein [Streptomyces sp. TRM75563]|uniref:dienelactone hydrolase family protein n=1 Tax=Streptomyces sp. TRM75563 TaxID=2817418 RepID=UPI001F61EBAC|nr:dienelactone hydrolase family protein [Streptomyces sp. TRM75563]MCI4039981.1 dienelactone hydrolase family protein [Streptomyces sp. TRM75563]